MAASTTQQQQQHQQQQVQNASQCQFQPISSTSPHYTFSSTSESPSLASLLRRPATALSTPPHYSQDQRQQQQQHHQFLPYQFPSNHHAWKTAPQSHQSHQQSQFQHQPAAQACQTSTSPLVDQAYSTLSQHQVYRYDTPRSFPIAKAQYTPAHIPQHHYHHSFSHSEIHHQYPLQRSRSSITPHAYPTPPPSMSIGAVSQARGMEVAKSARKTSATRGIKRNSQDAELEDAEAGSVTELDTSEDEPEDDDDEYNPQSPNPRSRSVPKTSPKSTPTSEVADKESGKPYAVLVYEALMSMETCSMTVSEIYDYFKKHHPHFRNVKGRGWMNSIRYNLSMNEGFKLVQRPEGQEGKGGIWMVTAEAQKNGIKSTTRSRQSNSPRKKRYQSTSYSLRVRRQPLVPVMVASQHYSLPTFEDDSDFDYEYDEDYAESHQSYLGRNGPITPQSPYFPSYQDSTSFYPCLPSHDLDHALVRYNKVDSEPVSLKIEDGSPVQMYMPEHVEAYPSPPAQEYGNEVCGFGSSDQQFMLAYDQSLFEEQFNITQFMDSYGNVTPLNASFV